MDRAQSLSKPERFVTVKVVAAEIGAPEFKVRRAVKTGLIPSYQFANGRILLRLSEVIACIERTRTGGAQ